MIPDWTTVKSELAKKWWIILICAVAGIYQGLLFVFPSLPNPFKF